MKTIVNTRYVCEICGFYSENEDQVKECESGHVFVKVDSLLQTFRSNSDYCEYPQSLKIKLENGDVVEYSQMTVNRREQRKDCSV